jgi:hypothetical protein
MLSVWIRDVRYSLLVAYAFTDGEGFLVGF